MGGERGAGRSGSQDRQGWGPGVAGGLACGGGRIRGGDATSHASGGRCRAASRACTREEVVTPLRQCAQDFSPSRAPCCQGPGGLGGSSVGVIGIAGSPQVPPRVGTGRRGGAPRSRGLPHLSCLTGHPDRGRISAARRLDTCSSPICAPCGIRNRHRRKAGRAMGDRRTPVPKGLGAAEDAASNNSSGRDLSDPSLARECWIGIG